MHPKYPEAERISPIVIGGAMEVHTHFGPGLIESIYERCLEHELGLRGLTTVRQKIVPVVYKTLRFDDPLRFDLLVNDSLLVEGKAVETLLPIHQAQLLSYMKLLSVSLGLLFNFHEEHLKDGLRRVILPGANLP